MKMLLCVLAFMLVTMHTVHAQLRSDPYNTVPAVPWDRNGPTNIQTWMKYESASIRGRILSPFVDSGGLFVIASGLTTTAVATTAYVPERVQQAAIAITFANVSAADVCWVIISSQTSAIALWTRVNDSGGTGTAYFYRCQGSATPVRPTLPANSTWVSEATIASSALSKIQPIANSLPLPLSSTQGMYSIKEFGAKCDGITDDSGAFTLANSVLAARDTIFIPAGQCRVSSTVTFTKAINIVGIGPASQIYLTVDTSSDGIVYNAGGTTLLYGPILQDFAIIGPASSARNCLVIRYSTIARVNRVHVFCGTPSTGYGVWLQDNILEGYFNFIINGTYLGYPAVGAVPANGIKATTTPGDTAGTFNSNVFDLDISGPATAGSTGLWIFSAGGGGGNNEVRGTYQGWVGDGIYLNGGDGAYVHDAHLEGGDSSRSNRLHVQNLTRYKLGPNILVTAGTPAQNILVQTSTSGVIEGVAGDVFRLDGGSNNVISKVQTQGVSSSHVEDAALYTTWLSSAVSTGDLRIETGSLTDGSSIALNGSGERWDTTPTTLGPPSIIAAIGGGFSWSRESTIVKHGRYSINTTTTASGLTGVQILTAAQTALLAGRKVTFSAWVYVPGGQPDITPTLYFDQGANTAGYNVISSKNAWIQITGAVAVAANGTIGAGGYTDVKLMFIPASGTTQYYVDAVSVIPSFTGASVYYTGNPNEFLKYDRTVTAVAPGPIAAGTTASTIATVLGAATGDICSLGPPAAIAAGLGWSCVVTAADTVDIRIHNVSTGSITPTSASWSVLITRRP